MAATLIVAANTVAAQTGTVSLLCIDNQNPNNRIGFDIDYNRKTIVGDISRGRGQYINVQRWDGEFIVWGYGPPNTTLVLYTLNRRTRVLFQTFFPENEGSTLVCSRSEERPL
jgi:hypothetical protein